MAAPIPSINSTGVSPSLGQPSHRWFPGYTVAAVSAVGLIATAPGQTIVIAQLNGPLSSEFELTPLALNTAYTLATMAAALPLVFVGGLADRLGPRRTMALVAGAFAAGCIAMGCAQGLVGVFLGFFLLRFLGQGSLALVCQHALAMWFHRRLGSIQGIKSVVIFVAWIPLPLVTAAMIDGVGWRTTYFIFAGAIAATVIPLSLRFVRDRPEQMGLRMDNDAPEPAETDFSEEVPEATGAGPYPGLPALPKGASRTGSPSPARRDFTLREAGRTAAFWIVTSAFFLSPLVGTALLFDMQPMLDANGKSGVAAATPISVWTATMALMALPAGYLTDRVRASALVAGGMALIGLSPLVMWLKMDLVGASAAMVLFGVGQTLVAASGTAAIARFFGRTHHGAIRGSIARIGVFGTGLGPLVMALSLWLTESHAAGLIGMAVATIPVVAASLLLAHPARPQMSAAQTPTSG